jgi:preprotein translocase subunit SecA
MSFINSIIKAFIGDKSQKDVKATQPYINKIKAIEPVLASLSHDELRAKTAEFKEKIKQARAKQDAEIEAKKTLAENTADIDQREDIYNAIDALAK